MTSERKEILTVRDLQEMLGGVCYNTATKIMREVKACSDRLSLKGMIHRLDWEDFLQRQNKDN